MGQHTGAIDYSIFGGGHAVFSNRRRRLGIESLETRTMLAADLLNGALSIVGTKGNDNIQVQVAAAGPHTGELQVDVNGQQSFFTANQVTSIQILGLGGNDQITVNDNVAIHTTIRGGKGNDTIKGGGGDDTIYGDAGNDSINSSLGNDTVFAGSGNDNVHCGDGTDTVHGEAGNDSIWGGDDDDSLDGDQGNDSLDGEAGNDTCHGDNGNDTIHGGDDNDELYGDNGKDQIWGGNGNDFADGGNGTDDCHGEAGDDQLKGGNGRDRLNGDGGSNLCDRDNGDDDVQNGEECDLDSKFRALLIGQNSETGRAKFESENENNSVKTNFELEVHNLAANSSFDIVIDGVTVGQITTDGSGEGEIHYSSNPSGGDEVAYPGNFPTLHSGSTILIGNVLQGTFQTWHAMV